MSVTSSTLTVVAFADSSQRLRDVITATQMSLGQQTPIVAIAQRAVIDDLEYSNQKLPHVHLVDESSSLADIAPLIQSRYVLNLPPSSPIMFTGVNDAISLLESLPHVLELGGLVIDSRGVVVSGAFVTIHRPSTGSIALAPVEETHPDWTRHGNFAYTPSDYLGGASLIRRENLSDGHFHGGSLIGRALSAPLVDETHQRMLYSGLIALTRWGVDINFQDSGENELLPVASQPAWLKAGIHHITVLHRGAVLRHDALRRVVFLADNRIASVDGAGSRPAMDPSRYYLLTGSRIQLGPGFLALSQLINRESNWQAASSDYRGSLERLTDIERFILVRARRLGGRLPGPMLRFLRRLLKKSLRVQP